MSLLCFVIYNRMSNYRYTFGFINESTKVVSEIERFSTLAYEKIVVMHDTVLLFIVVRYNFL